MTVEADQRYIVDVVNYQLVVRFLGKSNLIDSPFSAEYRDVFFVAVCAANPEIRPFVFPAVSASFLCDACAVDGFGLASQLRVRGSFGLAYALAHGLLCYYTISVVLSIAIIMVI